MALILTGNFSSEDVKPLIEKKFGRLKAKNIPERPTYTEVSFSGNPSYSAKIGYTPTIIWGYKGVPVGHEDEILLDFCVDLLSNPMNTGLLDKITLDGEVQYAGASVDSRRDQGRFLIQAVPYYDANQRRYDSNRATEKIVMQQVDKLKSGNIDDWLIESVRSSQLREYELMLNSSSKVNILANDFAYNLQMDYFFECLKKIRRSRRGYSTNYQESILKQIIYHSIEQGTPKKDKLKKPI